jgi:hypothetical protein
LACEKAVFIRFGVAARKILEARVWRGRCNGCRDNAPQGCAARQDGQEAIEHTVSRFAYGEDPDVRKVTKIVAAIRAAEMVGGDRQAAFDGDSRIDRFERATEDLPGKVFAVHRLEV